MTTTVLATSAFLYVTVGGFGGLEPR